MKIYFGFRLTVDAFLLISNIGGFAVYSLFIAQNLEKVLSSAASFNVHWDYRAYLLIILAPTMVLCSIRKIANLTWIMIFANCCEFYVISVVLYYYFRSPLPDIATRSVVGPVDRIPVFFGSGTTFANTALDHHAMHKNMYYDEGSRLKMQSCLPCLGWGSSFLWKTR